MVYSMAPDFPGAMKPVVLAKGFIDKAAAHPDTKESQKMYYYKGEIYFALSILLEMDSSIAAVSSNDALDTLKTWETGIKLGEKYTFEIERAVDEKRAVAYLMAGTLWKAEKYAEAGEAFELCALISNSIGILDTSMISRSGLSYDNAQMIDDAVRMYDQLAAVNYRGAKGAQLLGDAHF